MTDGEKTAGGPARARPIRKQKRAMPARGAACLNCGVKLKGPFCHDCGQDSDLKRRPFFKLIVDALDSMFEWDGRLMRTIPLVFFRPGLLARDYLEGRVVRHMPPFKTFFIALIVLLFGYEFFASRPAVMGPDAPTQAVALPKDYRLSQAEIIGKTAARHRAGRLMQAYIDREKALAAGTAPAQAEAEYRARAAAAEKVFKRQSEVMDMWISGKFGALTAEDFRGSGGIRGEQSDVERRLEKAFANPDQFMALALAWAHRLAILLLPIMAFALGLVYVRQRRFLMVDHFTVAMVMLTFVFFTSAVTLFLPPALSRWFSGLLFIWSFINLFQILRGAYGSSIVGALLKSLFIWIISGIASIAVFSVIVVLALRQM